MMASDASTILDVCKEYAPELFNQVMRIYEEFRHAAAQRQMRQNRKEPCSKEDPR